MGKMKRIIAVIGGRRVNKELLLEAEKVGRLIAQLKADNAKKAG